MERKWFEKEAVGPIILLPLKKAEMKGEIFMLRLDKIVKTYKTADMEVRALKGVSLSFRKNEFVSILGPSGCGKTTMLNVIGGLDHYDEGDLYILGHSTKKFSDRDWDVYRNHRIGFVFQSYNLIPQSNIQQNVELGLTISGLNKAEREAKARAALDKVGLSGMYKKRPNQLSGGQCQRVAIARAIVNNPDIILADEPTGALDSVTSVQVMDILKEIARDRLVIMVTHNPELAEKYSTRIIKLLDGNVVDDSMPYDEEEEKAEFGAAAASTKSNLSKDAAEEKAKMSWATAFALSGRNLWAKHKRTAMIVVASSIGIVGVSAVLGVSTGVTNYIASMQDDMLSGNPVKVSKSSLDLSSLMSLSSASTPTKASAVVNASTKPGYIDVNSIVKQLVDATDGLGSSLTQNDISSDYVHFVDDMPREYYAAISKDYGLDVLNNIYTTDKLLSADGSEREVDVSVASLVSYAVAIISQTEYSTFASQIPSFTNVVMQSLDDTNYIANQYETLAGKIATEPDEMMIVLDHNRKVSDFLLTMLGYYSQADLMNSVYANGYDDDDPVKQAHFDKDRYDEMQSISLDSLLGKTFHYYVNDTIYSPTSKTYSYKDPKTKEDKTVTYDTFDYEHSRDASWNDESHLEMKVVGVIAPKADVNYGCLETGLYYTPAFSRKFIEDNKNSKLASYVKSSGGSVTNTVSSTATSTSEMGVTYSYDYWYWDTKRVTSSPSMATMTAPVGKSTIDLTSAMTAFLGMSGESSGNSGTSLTATMSTSSVGASTLPDSISFFPNTFDTKFQVTDYLDKWNAEGDIVLSNGDLIKKADRAEIKYTDNLQVIISMINQIIQIVTIALVAFTSLSLVVSTVMIGIITYVSVMERVKEIGVIRSLGGRKKDVSHLFNAETFIIGSLSGLFGIVVTYVIEVILNLALKINFGVTIMALSPAHAGIIILIAVLLTMFAGLLPSAAAAREDPVVALRTE